MKIEPTTIVDDATLAALVGVSARRIRQLVEAGDITRVARNQFHLGPARRELLEQAAGEGTSGELIRERVRATKAAADLREIEVLKARGELARIEDFRRVQSARNFVIRQNMLNVPTRAVLQLLGCTDETEFKTKLRAEIIQALRTAYETRVDLEAVESTPKEADGQ
jgi:phage terminase Nu1 subunit (DNA packaging protein)